MKETIARSITGIVVLAIGAGALLDAFNIFEFWPILGNWWPVFVILSGVVIVLGDKRQYIWAIALVLIGTLLLLNNLDISDTNVFELVWPVIIIAVGLSILRNKSGSASTLRTQDTDTINALFSGTETRNASKNYQGGSVSAIFGGVQLDLSDAVIKKEATLNVSAICGGIEIRVPRNWRVQSNVFPILGGVENKTHSNHADNSAPLLIIAGTATLGGVEIKS